MTKKKSTNAVCYRYNISLFLLLLALVTLYVYLLSATVWHVVMQKEAAKQIHNLHSEIALLEAEYIDRQHHLTNAIAELDGYQPVANKIFIDKSDTNLVLEGGSY